MPPKKELTKEELIEKFKQVSASTINEQTNAFLRGFVAEFSGNFEEVLDMAEEFRGYAPAEGDVHDLEEDKAHLFLEKRGEAETVKALRDHLKEMDLDKNHRLSFIEYLLYKYDKSVKELFEEKEGNLAHLLAKLEEAIATYQEQLAKKKAREEKMKQLEELGAAGGVKGMKAIHELEAMRNEDALARNKAEIAAGAKKRAAKRAVDQGDPFLEEQKRLEAEKKAKEAEAQLQRQASRDRLAAKAKLWS